MIFDLIKTLVKMIFTIIVLILIAVLSPLFFLFLTPEDALKTILKLIVGAMIIMGYNKNMLITDVTFDVNDFA